VSIHYYTNGYVTDCDSFHKLLDAAPITIGSGVLIDGKEVSEAVEAEFHASCDRFVFAESELNEESYAMKRWTPQHIKQYLRQFSLGSGVSDTGVRSANLYRNGDVEKAWEMIPLHYRRDYEEYVEGNGRTICCAQGECESHKTSVAYMKATGNQYFQGGTMIKRCPCGRGATVCECCYSAGRLSTKVCWYEE
jgi:hypothetical protein